MNHRRILVAALALAAAFPYPTGVPAADPGRCRLEPVNGSCKAMMERFRFDPVDGVCVPYIYDGCGPVVPFESAADCRRACESAGGLSLAPPRDGESWPEMTLDVAYPKAWPDGTPFKVWFDGRAARSRVVGGGSSTDANLATLQAEIPGHGCRAVTVGARTPDGPRAATLDHVCRPVAALLPLGRFGDHELLTEPVTLEVLPLGARAPKILHRGVEVPLQAPVVSSRKAPWRASPPWAPGLNAIRLQYADADGKTVSRDMSFVYAPGWTLRAGEQIRFVYGHPGSRSGPFFSVAAEGDAITLEPAGEVRLDILDDDGWPAMAEALIAEVMAQKPGRAIIRIAVKDHFRNPPRPEREIAVTVVEAGAGR